MTFQVRSGGSEHGLPNGIRGLASGLTFYIAGLHIQSGTKRMRAVAPALEAIPFYAAEESQA
jgi:hypothetical protein